jgi:hypothetical protein
MQPRQAVQEMILELRALPTLLLLVVAVRWVLVVLPLFRSHAEDRREVVITRTTTIRILPFWLRETLGVNVCPIKAVLMVVAVAVAVVLLVDQEPDQLVALAALELMIRLPMER